MGWWGYGIMEGDPPLDALGGISDILKVPNDDALAGKEDPKDYCGYALYPLANISPEHGKRIAKALKKNWSRIEAKIKEWGNDPVDIQVLAAVIMASGASFPRGFKKRAIQAGKDDSWAKEDREDGEEDSERIREIQKYIEIVKSYKAGTQTMLEHESLFEKMFG